MFTKSFLYIIIFNKKVDWDFLFQIFKGRYVLVISTMNEALNEQQWHKANRK